ncbi:MDR family MFS transporter [Paenibacillus sp. JX-17]|uniref:MDR family MFS transporter n=1 Tax=Paenibacillus lacisoli TaxID=3064525 RepID=A0ABT9CAI2_9BACL|nr:MDR family MFS transporter [Paenibacillus sp. JX-17]MDO7906256.1 MDR family MFS transporter [Paenibacillus sp. JX-17]
MSEQTASRTHEDDSYKWKVLASVVIGLFMVILDSTIVNVALRALQLDFTASTTEVQWVISLYTMALGVATPLSGFLGTRYGSKRIFLTGLTLFITGSALCALAPSLPLLIAARAIQGIGGGMALPLGTAMLFRAFPVEQRGIAFGVFGIVLVFAPASGPILGGWFVDHDMLSWIFWINVPIGIIGITMGNRLLRKESGTKLPVNWLGILLAPLSFGLILFAASSAGESGVGWSSPRVIYGLIAGGLVLALLVFTQLRSKHPLLDLRLFQYRSFAVGSVVGVVGSLALFGAEFLLPLYLQILRGKTAFEAGLFLLPLAIASGVMVPIAGKLADKFGPRVPIIIGFLLLIFNTYQLSQITLDTSLTYILFLTILRGIGVAFVIQNAQVAALSEVPPARLNGATPLYSASSQVVQSLGVAVLATILSSAVTTSFPSSGGTPDPQALAQFNTQYVTGLEHAYLAALVITVFVTVIAFFLPGRAAQSKTEKAAS